MPEPMRIAKARLEELQADLETPRSGGKRVTVQFNPESLKVNFANQIQAPNGGSGGGSGDSARPPAVQFVGAGTTKLAVTLWFDASAPLDAEMLPEAERGAGKVDDVRKLTEQVAWFITPQPQPANSADPDRYLPPAVSFAWGSFLFNGIVESIEENLEFFSPEGRPLRASLLLKLIQPRITAYRYGQSGAGNTAGASVLGGAPGTRPLTGATEGASLQAMAASAGRADDWKAIASANGIEDPLRMQAGQRVDMRAGSQTRGKG
ncbi:MAG: hypothetical protein KAX66_04085 [Propionivibrio sp.]|jgi:hypothetical protein|nr:hypothetical protein [Propionivibrio sp.]